ncbi:MAG TPA: glycosyltransferase [Gaiellaceae bacterium]|nr:glycosyltransferase [Gaiellaceae bacterium]
MNAALVHDYVTQRGGAERVVLSMLRAFPGAPLYTSLYEPRTTFAEFRSVDVRPLRVNRIRPLRRRHRLALPLLASAFSGLHVRADVVVCSSSGWAHGAQVSGRKVVYCYTPARWLYEQADVYLGERRRAARVALAAVRGRLRRWDQTAAASAARYLTSSRTVRDRIHAVYGIDAEVLPPPPTLDVAGAAREVDGLSPGFILCVSRLLPYKNVAAVVDAFRRLAGEQLVVVGTGPEAASLRARAGANVRFLGAVSDDSLRWLYRKCQGVVAASFEDYGLIPLEAATFGKPSAVLRWGGFLDTVVEGTTGVFFDRPDEGDIVAALRELTSARWREDDLVAHAAHYSEDKFIAGLRRAVSEVG